MFKVSEYHVYRVNNVYKIKVKENCKLNIVFFGDFNHIFTEIRCLSVLLTYPNPSKVSEYDQEIPQSQKPTADQPTAP